MEERIARRRFVAFAGAAGFVGVAGCSGDEQPSDEGGSDGNGGGNEGGDDGGNGSADGQDGDEEEDQESEQPFDFPPGANENGIVTDTVVPGARQVLENAGRYRIEQTHELDAPEDSWGELSATYDVDERLVHERVAEEDVEIDRWVSPDRMAGQSVDLDLDRTYRWEAPAINPAADSNDRFNGYPFAETTAASLLRSASFEFDGVVAGVAPDSGGSDDSDGGDGSDSDDSDGGDGEPTYARYVGDITGAEDLELRQPETARTDYRLESTSGGRVSILLDEGGGVPFVEYEFAGVAIRQTHEGREEIEIETSGEIRFEYEGEFDPVEKPEWAESPDPNQVRQFELTDTSLGRTYSLVGDGSLPSTQELEYVEFYIMAEFGSERYFDRYAPRAEFDSKSGVVVGFDDGQFEMDRQSFSGRDALVEADRIEMSIYMYVPREGKTQIYHEERTP